MDTLKGFFKENAKITENEKIVISERFVDDNGKPIVWEIKAIGNDEDDKLREDSTTQEKVKKSQFKTIR